MSKKKQSDYELARIGMTEQQIERRERLLAERAQGKAMSKQQRQWNKALRNVQW